MGVGESHDQRLQQLPLLDAVSQFLYPCGVDGAYTSLGDDDLAEIDVEHVPHERDPRHACRLRTPALATPPISAPVLASTHANRSFQNRVAGAENCKQTRPGIAVAGLPPSMNRGQKKTRTNASAWADYRHLGVLRHQHFCCRFTSACQQVFWMQTRQMCGILAHMPCGDGDLASSDLEDVSHGRTPRHACRLRTPAPATRSISASVLASTHANRKL